ncbi:MAG: DNA starvation/stationary phase protection protein [Acidimicrobiaceae bacterium]|nr:DNA starvation/stationary phase protection protein [Acidimicrobiaceae bacterium]
MNGAADIDDAIDVDIDTTDRTAIADGLSRVLADSYTLSLKTRNYHWNVVGPMFTTLHLMFEEQYDELASAVDEIAERIRALGEPAPGSYVEFVQLSSVGEDAEKPEATEMIRRLLEGHETVAHTVRSIVPTVEAAGDGPTADLLNQRLLVHEKTAWMLRSLVT